MNELTAALAALDAQGAFDLPLPGQGCTQNRLRALLSFGRQDLSLARLAEAHTDALAILAEDQRTHRHPGLYGVWASEGPRSLVSATPHEDGGWTLNGLKQYCSGASLLQAALVTAHSGDKGVLLFEVVLDTPGIRVLPTTWASSAFADTSTDPVEFFNVALPGEALIGPPGFYLERPGFWHGALGPAACWAGGAISLVDAATRLNRKDAHSRAHLGALQASAWALETFLLSAGKEIDDNPTDSNQARRRALTVRHLVERTCAETLDRFGRATGPQLLAFDGQVARQHAALAVYIRQCHGERDLESIPE